jgi:hypothetical protein
MSPSSPSRTVRSSTRAQSLAAKERIAATSASQKKPAPRQAPKKKNKNANVGQQFSHVQEDAEATNKAYRQDSQMRGTGVSVPGRSVRPSMSTCAFIFLHPDSVLSADYSSVPDSTAGPGDAPVEQFSPVSFSDPIPMDEPGLPGDPIVVNEDEIPQQADPIITDEDEDQPPCVHPIRDDSSDEDPGSYIPSNGSSIDSSDGEDREGGSKVKGKQVRYKDFPSLTTSNVFSQSSRGATLKLTRSLKPNR